MKTAHELRPAFGRAVLTLLCGVWILQCGPVAHPVRERGLLDRIPAENKMVFTIRPAAIMETPIIQAVLALHPQDTTLAHARREVQRYVGIDPFHDIEQVVFMSRDTQAHGPEVSVLVSGTLQSLMLDSLFANHSGPSPLAQVGVRDSLITIRGEKVRVLTAPQEAPGRRLFLHAVPHEVLITMDQPSMDRLLSLRGGGAGGLADEPQFVDRIESLRHREHAWGMLPLDSMMADVLEKVRQQIPDYQQGLLDISSIQGGVTLGTEVGISLQAYCQDAQQAQLLAETCQGFLALGKLTAGALPPVRRLLNQMTITQDGDRLDITATIAPADLQALRELEQLGRSK